MILAHEKVVVEKMDSFETVPNGRLIRGVVYPFGEVLDITVPEEVISQKYCYETGKGFYLNEVYKNSMGEQIKAALDAYTLELMEGGLL